MDHSSISQAWQRDRLRTAATGSGPDRRPPITAGISSTLPSSHCCRCWSSWRTECRPVKCLKIKAKKKDQSYLYPANTAESLVCLSLGLILRCWLGINSFDVFFCFDIKKSHWNSTCSRSVLWFCLFVVVVLATWLDSRGISLKKRSGGVWAGKAK